MLVSLRKFASDDIAQKRKEMIDFYDQFGEAATTQAFGADRKVISRWKKRLISSGGKLTALSPTSTRPHHVRRSTTDPRIVSWIKTEREAHPRIGKEKLKPDLDIYCQSLGIPYSININDRQHHQKKQTILPKNRKSISYSWREMGTKGG